MNASPTVSELLRAHPIDRSIPTEGARGAVLAVVRDGPAGAEVLLIERTHRDGDPASGQVALPGGTADPSDPSLAVTALRECQEEVGIGAEEFAQPPRFVRIGWVYVQRLPIAVFLAPFRDGGRSPHRASPREVASVFWFPLREVLPGQVVRVETQIGPRDVDATVFDGHVLWGFTRKVLVDLVAAAPTVPSEASIRPTDDGGSEPLAMGPP